jgi:hypothetical protein
MEESVSDKPEELLFSFWTLHVSASGSVSFIVAAAVSMLIVAVAWRIVRR